MLTPGVCCSTCSTLVSALSSIIWRVNTVIDCGVSRGFRLSRVALLLTEAAYEPVPSVVPSVLAWAEMVTTGSMLSAPRGDGCGAAGVLPST